MNPAAGSAVIALSAVAIVAVSLVVRSRGPGPVTDLGLGVAGAALAAGGLLWLDDVGTWSWVAAPAGFAVMTPVHVRALFAGAGPLRT